LSACLSHRNTQIWYEKSIFVRRAIAANPFGTHWFAWLDLGNMRDSSETALERARGWPHGGAWSGLPLHSITLLGKHRFEEADRAIEDASMLVENLLVDRTGGG
jgi:hypothetical protein